MGPGSHPALPVVLKALTLPLSPFSTVFSTLPSPASIPTHVRAVLLLFPVIPCLLAITPFVSLNYKTLKKLHTLLVLDFYLLTQ